MTEFAIPEYLIRDEYLQLPIVLRFLHDHSLPLSSNLKEAVEEIQCYANISQENKDVVISWLSKIVREGSKEFCFKRILEYDEVLLSPKKTAELLKKAYSVCLNKSLLEYTNTGERRLVNFRIIGEDRVKKIELTFSQLFLCAMGKEKQSGTRIYPVFIDVDLEMGYIISRQRAKSTLFEYSESNPELMSEFRINTKKHAANVIKEVAEVLELSIADAESMRYETYSMIFKLYNDLTFTPKCIKDVVEEQKHSATKFVNSFFENLSLTPINKGKAIRDILIIIEKYLSIDRNSEELFINDRPAYVTKISSDNDEDFTRIETMSMKETPLQTTEAFFDSKKSIENAKQCKKIKMVFKRRNQKYFGSSNQLVVEVGFGDKCSYIKTFAYAEEEDIQNVLQTVLVAFGQQ